MRNELIKIFFLRLITSFVILFLVVSFVFVIIHISPGNPAQKFITPTINQKLYEEINSSYSLNESLVNQYLSFIQNTFSGDLGISFNYRKHVMNVIKPYISFTILFGIVSFIFQIGISFLFVYISLRIGSTWFTKLMTNINLALYSIPVFVSSILLVYIFSFQLNILPSSGIKSLQYAEQSVWWNFMDYSRHLILPLVASSFTAIPIYYKYLYGSIKDIGKSNYIKNLELLGIGRKRIFIKNILPNSLGTLISVAGVELGILLGGSVIVETIFGLPGMGRLTLSAVITRDYPLIIGTVIISSVIVLFVNLIADMLKVIIDKRLLKNVLS